MELFKATPYFLLLEQEDSSREALEEANTEFVKEVYKLQCEEKDGRRLFFQLQYLNCRLVILREHYRASQKEHLFCYSHVVGSIHYLKELLKEIPLAGGNAPASPQVTRPPTEDDPPVLWTSDVINLIELLYSCHELKLFNKGNITLKVLVGHFCKAFGIDVKNASNYYQKIRMRKAEERTYFLDRLKEALLQKMECDDERLYHRNK